MESIPPSTAAGGLSASVVPAAGVFGAWPIVRPVSRHAWIAAPPRKPTPAHRPETVHVLHFHDRRGGLPCGRVDVQVDVGVHPQAAFLHVAVGNPQVVQQELQLGEVGFGLGGRAHVGLADDFQQRHAARFRSMRLSALPAASSCMLLPASSSRWARMMPIRFGSIRPLRSLIASQPS